VGKTLGDEFWAFGYDLTEQKFAEEALRRYAERLQNLHKIDQAILQAIESPETIVHTALQHLCGLLQCERASVGIFELKKKQVRVFAAEVNGERIVQTGIDLAEEAYGDLDILRQGTMEVVEDMSKVPSPPAAARILQVKGVSACINVPLLSVQGLYGALNIGWEEARPITAEEREIAGEAAGQITIAIEQAHLLQETKRYAVELEQRVADRTAQLEAANNELEAFSYSVSHDLRAPLRAIDGYDRILLEDYADRLDDEGRRVLGVISSETHRMGQLVDDLLAFSRMGRQKQEISEIDMTALAQEVFVEHAALAPKRTLQLKLEPLSPARGDRAMLRVVLVNLLSNAIKFTQSRNPAVIEVGSRREDGQTVYYVKDNGVGFDMRYASKLFGVFQRLHSAEDFEGTGVGLALVQRIVHRHGGRVWFEAKVNEGAILFFSLPDMKENL
jgi:signal transduction histidine kinase